MGRPACTAAAASWWSFRSWRGRCRCRGGSSSSVRLPSQTSPRVSGARPDQKGSSALGSVRLPKSGSMWRTGSVMRPSAPMAVVVRPAGLPSFLRGQFRARSTRTANAAVLVAVTDLAAAERTKVAVDGDNAQLGREELDSHVASPRVAGRRGSLLAGRATLTVGSRWTIAMDQAASRYCSRILLM